MRNSEGILDSNRRWLVLILPWTLSVIAVLPVIFHWTPSAPLTGVNRFIPIGFGYLAAAAICYWMYRAESRHHNRSHAFVIVFLVLLLTAITNSLHGFNVDKATNYFLELTNQNWQNAVQKEVIELSPKLVPHSYRFLPNSIVLWIQLAGVGFESARDLYRLIFSLLLFYSIYRYARLYCNFLGALIAMLFISAIYPVSFEYYAGQLTDPVSHLSFVLAFIFLEIEEFGLLLSTLLIGSLAKESVLAMAGYYVLFCRKQKNYPWKASVLCLAAVGAYFGTRWFVLHGAMNYKQVSDTTLEHVSKNWLDIVWIEPFLLTACALTPFVALGWKETPRALKQLAIFLLPVLFLSSLFFSWLKESRNFMPLVFVMAVATGNYLSRILVQNRNVTGVRIDKWLWAARFFKTRSLAVDACEHNRIHSNGHAAKAAREVKVGDLLQIKNDGGDFQIEVLALSDTRGPASVAQTLYRETEASHEARAKLAEERKSMPFLDTLTEGRPSKKDRRVIDRLRGR